MAISILFVHLISADANNNNIYIVQALSTSISRKILYVWECQSLSGGPTSNLVDKNFENKIRTNSERNDVNLGNTNEKNMWTSQLNRTDSVSNCEVARKKKKFSGASTGGLCVRAAVFYKLSYEVPHTGGRPICWVHQPVNGMKHKMEWCELVRESNVQTWMLLFSPGTRRGYRLKRPFTDIM